jgi:hypothetical protein
MDPSPDRYDPNRTVGNEPTGSGDPATPGPQDAPLSGASRAYPGYHALTEDETDLGPITDAFEREAGAMVVALPDGPRLFPASAIARGDHERRVVVLRLDAATAGAMPPWTGGVGSGQVARDLVYEAEQALSDR